MLGMPALIIVVRESHLQDHHNFQELIFRPPRYHRARYASAVLNTSRRGWNQPSPFTDRRYTYIEQAGCIPSISPSLFPLVGVLIWPLLFNVASLAYLGIFLQFPRRKAANDRPGLITHFIWAPGFNQGETQKSYGAITLHHLLRVSTSLFLGIICTSSFSLFLLLSIVNNSKISVNSLLHDFQTVYIISTDRWSRSPQFRAAVELRWLWASLGFALAIGSLPKERADRLVGWLATAKLYIQERSANYCFRNTLHTQRGSRQGVAPVYFECCLPWVPSRVCLRAAVDVRTHLYLASPLRSMSTTRGAIPRPRPRYPI